MSGIKKITQWLVTPSGVFHTILVIQLLVFVTLIFRPFFLVPPGHMYPVLDKNYLYTDFIRQATEQNDWKVFDTHTTLGSPRLYIYLFFVALGKISAITHMPPAWMYVLARILCGMLAMYATYWFIKTFLPKQMQSLAIILSTAIESGPLLSALPEYKTLFDNRILIERNFGLPHHLFAQAIGLLFIGTLLVSLRKLTPKRATVLLLSGLISTTAMPGYVFAFALLSLLPIGIWSVVTGNIKRHFWTFLIAGIAIAVPNIIIGIEFSKGLPWTNSTPNEKTWFTTDFIRMEYISCMLLYLPLLATFPIALVHLWRTWSSDMKLTIAALVCWLVGPLLWVKAAEYSWFPMPNHRLTDGYGYIPAGILATVGFYGLMSTMRHKPARIIVGMVLLGVTFVSSLYLSTIFTNKLFAAQHPTNADMFPTQETWDGVMFLATIPKYSGLLVREHYGEFIPAFVPVRTYVGGIDNFPDWLSWQWLARKFFSTGMTNDEVKSFLKANDITYVFDGPDEKQLHTAEPLYPNIVTPIFSNTSVTIYRVK